MLTASPSGRCAAPAVRLSFPVAVPCLAVNAWELECRRVDDLKAFISRPLLLLFCNDFNPPTVRLACAKGYSLVDVSPACALYVVWPPFEPLVVRAPVFGLLLVLANGRLVFSRLRW